MVLYYFVLMWVQLFGRSTDGLSVTSFSSSSFTDWPISMGYGSVPYLFLLLIYELYFFRWALRLLNTIPWIYWLISLLKTILSLIHGGLVDLWPRLFTFLASIFCKPQSFCELFSLSTKYIRWIYSNVLKINNGSFFKYS